MRGAFDCQFATGALHFGCGSRSAGVQAKVATATLRDYFSTHPQEYSDLRGILAPIKFMAG